MPACGKALGQAVVGMRAAGMPWEQHDRARLGIAGLTVKDLNARNLGRTVADLCVVPCHVQTPFLRCLVRVTNATVALF